MLLIGLTSTSARDAELAAHHLMRAHNFAHLRFAEPARDMLAALLELPREQLDRQLADPHWREHPLQDIGVSPQHLLDALSGAWGRNLISPRLWIVLLRRRLAFIEEALAHEYEGVVISDVLFDNEAAFIRSRGALVHLRRFEMKPAAGTAVQRRPQDNLLLCGTRQHLEQQLDQLLRALGKPGRVRMPMARYG